MRLPTTLSLSNSSISLTPLSSISSYSSQSLTSRTVQLLSIPALTTHSFDHSLMVHSKLPLMDHSLPHMSPTFTDHSLFSNTSVMDRLTPMQPMPTSLNYSSNLAIRPSFSPAPNLDRLESNQSMAFLSGLPKHDPSYTSPIISIDCISRTREISYQTFNPPESISLPYQTKNIPFREMSITNTKKDSCFDAADSSRADLSADPSIAILGDFRDMLCTASSPYDDRPLYTKWDKLFHSTLQTLKIAQYDQISPQMLSSSMRGNEPTQALVPFSSRIPLNQRITEPTVSERQNVVIQSLSITLTHFSGTNAADQPYASMPITANFVFNRTMQTLPLTDLRHLAGRFITNETPLQFRTVPLDTGALGDTYFNAEDLFLGAIPNLLRTAFGLGQTTRLGFNFIFKNKAVVIHVETQLLKLETNLAKQHCLNELSRMHINKNVRLLKFNEDNFRKNLIRVTQIEPGIAAQAHHTLPKKFVNQFAKLGINVHDPKFGSWWETTSHQLNAKHYNEIWLDFLQNNPTDNKAFNLALEMAEGYNFKTNF